MRAPADFVVIVLGIGGGLEEDNLSSYLVAPAGGGDFIALDAGTLNVGIRKALETGSFAGIEVPADAAPSPAAWVLREHVKAYLISHAHFDHVSGLIINSPNDSPKKILALDGTLDDLKEHIFNWRLWPNFGNEGVRPLLNRYDYVRLVAGRECNIAGTSMTVKAFPLSHADAVSTAFLIGLKGAYLVYCGDTGADANENSDKLAALWSALAPLIRARALKALFLETSFANGRPDHLLFGHLTPAWLIAELANLARVVDPGNPATALAGLNVVITHIKADVRRDVVAQDVIVRQLREGNGLEVNFIVPEQGQRLEF